MHFFQSDQKLRRPRSVEFFLPKFFLTFLGDLSIDIRRRPNAALLPQSTVETLRRRSLEFALLVASNGFSSRCNFSFFRRSFNYSQTPSRRSHDVEHRQSRWSPRNPTGASPSTTTSGGNVGEKERECVYTCVCVTRGRSGHADLCPRE